MELAHFLSEFWAIIIESAPALLLGFGIAGILSASIPQAAILEHLSRPGFLSVLKASAVGIPLPLCSCSVIPVGTALRRQGASPGATASFLISTPEIGIDSFLLSYVLLGPFIAFMRIGTAITSALTVGFLIDRTGRGSIEKPVLTPSCCGCEPKPQANSRITTALRYGFINLVDDLAPLLLFGIALSALFSIVIPQGFFLTLNLSDTALLFVALFISLPLYICASSSTPLAAVLIQKGLSVGAGLVFLCAGPASNFATILAVKNELGSRALLIYLSGIAVVTIAFGALTNHLVAQNPALVPVLQSEEHAHSAGLLRVILGVLLIVLLSSGLYRNLRKRMRPIRADRL